MVARRGRRDAESGLAGLRRSATLSELLFLYDAATQTSTRLRPIAVRLGVTVQAASHTFRQLSERGLAERRSGRYLPTVPGVAWLHRTLGDLSDDLFARQQRLPIVRSCRALAIERIAPGDAVVLEMRAGRLSARRGVGSGSRGRARTGGPEGTLIEVRELDGILQIEPAEVRIVTIPAGELRNPELVPAISHALAARPDGLVAARGLEAYVLTRRARSGPIVEFAAGSVAAEAALIGVPTTIVVLDEELARLLGEFPVAHRPTISVRPIPLGSARRGPPSRRRLRQRRR